MPTARHPGVALVLAALALASLACGGDDDETASSTTTTEAPTTTVTTTPPTTEPPTEEEAILAAVDGFIESTFTVNDPPNPDHPDLARYRTGEVLRTSIERVRERLELGQAFRLPLNSIYEHQPTVVSSESARAVVENCVVDDGQLVDRRTSEVLNNAVVTKLFRTTLLLENGLWKVAENVLLEEWKGVAGCGVA